MKTFIILSSCRSPHDATPLKKKRNRNTEPHPDSRRRGGIHVEPNIGSLVQIFGRDVLRLNEQRSADTYLMFAAFPIFQTNRRRRRSQNISSVGKR